MLTKFSFSTSYAFAVSSFAVSTFRAVFESPASIFAARAVVLGKKIALASRAVLTNVILQSFCGLMRAPFGRTIVGANYAVATRVTHSNMPAFAGLASEVGF